MNTPTIVPFPSREKIGIAISALFPSLRPGDIRNIKLTMEAHAGEDKLFCTAIGIAFVREDGRFVIDPKRGKLKTEPFSVQCQNTDPTAD